LVHRVNSAVPLHSGSAEAKLVNINPKPRIMIAIAFFMKNGANFIPTNLLLFFAPDTCG